MKQVIHERRIIQTPFPVEYGRASARRGGAPTLIPMESGAIVTATLLILDPNVSVEAAQDMLWRRETGQTEGKYVPPVEPTANQVVIDEYKDLGGVQLVLSTRLGTNIEALTAKDLARRAIASVKASGVREGEDGISYLVRAKSSGVVTPLTAAYERAILEQTKTNNLEEAVKAARF